MWGALILVGMISNAHSASEAQAKGCIDIATAPKGYYDLSGGNNNCPDGYELAPSVLTCTSIDATPTQYASPTGSDLTVDPLCPDGYELAPIERVDLPELAAHALAFDLAVWHEGTLVRTK